MLVMAITETTRAKRNPQRHPPRQQQPAFVQHPQQPQQRLRHIGPRQQPLGRHELETKLSEAKFLRTPGCCTAVQERLASFPALAHTHTHSKTSLGQIHQDPRCLPGVVVDVPGRLPCMAHAALNWEDGECHSFRDLGVSSTWRPDPSLRPHPRKAFCAGEFGVSWFSNAVPVQRARAEGSVAFGVRTPSADDERCLAADGPNT